MKILELSKKFWKPILIVFALVVGALTFKSCQKPVFDEKPSPLPEHVITRIESKNGTVRIRTPKDEKVITGVREGKIDIRDDGTVSVDLKDKGFTFQPMFGAAINSTGPKLSLLAEMGYWKYASVMAGVGFDNQIKNTVGILAFGYTPQFKYVSNTTFWAGIDTTKSPIGGVAWRF